MGFVSFAVIIITGIILGGILMKLLRGAMYFIISLLAVGIAYYLFVATPSQKTKMDSFANNISNSIYHIDINNISNKVRSSVNDLKEQINQKIDELKKK